MLTIASSKALYDCSLRICYGHLVSHYLMDGWCNYGPYCNLTPLRVPDNMAFLNNENILLLVRIAFCLSIRIIVVVE